jgi:hypothetical protein
MSEIDDIATALMARALEDRQVVLSDQQLLSVARIAAHAVMLIHEQWEKSPTVHAETDASGVTTVVDAESRSVTYQSGEPQPIIEAGRKLGEWLSAALDDPKACDEYKADIRRWFEVTDHWYNPNTIQVGGTFVMDADGRTVTYQGKDKHRVPNNGPSVAGKWPGNESEAELLAALKDMDGKPDHFVGVNKMVPDLGATSPLFKMLQVLLDGGGKPSHMLAEMAVKWFHGNGFFTSDIKTTRQWLMIRDEATRRGPVPAMVLDAYHGVEGK